MTEIKKQYSEWSARVASYYRDGKADNTELSQIIADCPVPLYMPGYGGHPNFNFDDPQHVKDNAPLATIYFTLQAN